MVGKQDADINIVSQEFLVFPPLHRYDDFLQRSPGFQAQHSLIVMVFGREAIWQPSQHLLSQQLNIVPLHKT